MANVSGKKKAKVFFEKAISPIQINMGKHLCVKVATPTCRGKMRGCVTVQQ